MAKKKIKDLTIAESKRICDGQLFCKDCSLYVREKEFRRHRVCLLDGLCCIPYWMLDAKVEFPEEAVGNSDQLEEENEQKI